MRYTEFNTLNSATAYKLSVKAVSETQHYEKERMDVIPESSPALIQVVTRPSSPSPPKLVEVSFHSAKLIWDAPAKIAVGAVTKDYILKYTTMDNNGSVTETGTDMFQSSFNKTYSTLSALVQGTTYGVRVKVNNIILFYSILYIKFVHYPSSQVQRHGSLLSLWDFSWNAINDDAELG